MEAFQIHASPNFTMWFSNKHCAQKHIYMGKEYLKMDILAKIKTQLPCGEIGCKNVHTVWHIKIWKLGNMCTRVLMNCHEDFLYKNNLQTGAEMCRDVGNGI